MDFYPTPAECTIALMEFLAMPKSIILEPACGEGHMSKVLETYGHTVISRDLRITGYGTAGIDFLNATRERCDAIITNPPFNIAEEFIKKALREADTVCMLLKAHYWNARKRYALFTSNPPAYILPLTWRPDFTGDGNATMDMIWTVWLPDVRKCEYVPLLKPKNDKQIHFII